MTLTGHEWKEEPTLQGKCINQTSLGEMQRRGICRLVIIILKEEDANWSFQIGKSPKGVQIYHMNQIMCSVPWLRLLNQLFLSHTSLCVWWLNDYSFLHVRFLLHHWTCAYSNELTDDGEGKQWWSRNVCRFPRLNECNEPGRNCDKPNLFLPLCPFPSVLCPSSLSYSFFSFHLPQPCSIFFNHFRFLFPQNNFILVHLISPPFAHSFCPCSSKRANSFHFSLLPTPQHSGVLMDSRGSLGRFHALLS